MSMYHHPAVSGAVKVGYCVLRDGSVYTMHSVNLSTDELVRVLATAERQHGESKESIVGRLCESAGVDADDVDASAL